MRDFNAKIDLLNLHLQWAEQPELVMYWNRAYADASRNWELYKMEAEIARADMKRVTAELTVEVSDNPDQFGLGRTTESTVSSTVIQQPEYIQAQLRVWKASKKVVEAQHAMDIVRAATKALEDRRRALENEVILHGRGYYAEPRVSAEAEAARANNDMESKRQSRGGGRPR